VDGELIMKINEYNEPYKELNVEEFIQKLVNIEADACEDYGLKPGSIIKSIYDAYEIERLEKEKKDGFTPYPGVINNQWS